jgi:hypothetical protein
MAKVFAILILLLVGIILFAGCSLNNTQKNNLDLNSNQSNSKENFIIDNSIVKKICNNELDNLDGYSEGEVLKCGKYYKKIPPRDLMDAPDLIYDEEGNRVTFCGGMPGPDGPREIPGECLVQCTISNLCLK